MRACFLGQNICSLGYGVAVLQAPPLVMDLPMPLPAEPGGSVGADQDASRQRDDRMHHQMVIPEALIGSRPVANPQRPGT